MLCEDYLIVFDTYYLRHVFHDYIFLNKILANVVKKILFRLALPNFTLKKSEMLK